MHWSIAVPTIKVGVVCKFITGRVIAFKLRFEVVCNNHFYKYFIHRRVVMVTVKVGVVNLKY